MFQVYVIVLKVYAYILLVIFKPLRTNSLFTCRMKELYLLRLIIISYFMFIMGLFNSSHIGLPTFSALFLYLSQLQL